MVDKKKAPLFRKGCQQYGCKEIKKPFPGYASGIQGRKKLKLIR
jgi:hypothetical protein